MKYCVLIAVLLMSGCASTQSSNDLLRDSIIIANTVRNLQQITGPGIQEELTNQTYRLTKN